MIQALEESSEFSEKHAIKWWHQCGKTITHWFWKHLAGSVGAFLVVIKERQIAEPCCPHTHGEKHQYRGSVALAVYFHFLKIAPQWKLCCRNTLFRLEYVYWTGKALELPQHADVCKDNHYWISIICMCVCVWGGIWFTTSFLGKDVSWTVLMAGTVSVCGRECVFNSSVIPWSKRWQIWFRVPISQTFLTWLKVFNTLTWKPLHLRLWAGIPGRNNNLVKPLKRKLP